MITDIDTALTIEDSHGISKKEIRSYEVSLWTLQDEFITVLKWANAEQQGRIREPKLTLNVDGTQNFTFTIPMYLNIFQEANRDNPRIDTHSRMIKQENPIWYNTRNGNLITSMRKIKVISNKGLYNKKIYDLIINKITEEHQGEQLLCQVECEGQAFHELGKIGYKYTLNKEVFDVDYKEWQETGHWYRKIDIKRENPLYSRPKANIQYWCESCGLKPRPNTNINPNEWYYTIDMNYNSFEKSTNRQPDILYEETYVSSWDDNLRPLAIEEYKEKERVALDIKESNLYNITQTIAETFGIFCRYDYEHDDNQQIISRTIVFYNNYIKDRENVISFIYPYSSSSISREMDSTELTTKMYVRCEDDSNTLEGDISIMNSEANKMGEDYLFNFDYFHDTGAITEEQYAMIEPYEISMHNFNNNLQTISLQIDALNKQKTDLDAEITVLNNSIEYDTEQINYASSLFNKLTTDGYITRNEMNPYYAYILEDHSTGDKYIKFNQQDKGIDASSVRIYKKYTASTCVLEDLIETSNYHFIYEPEFGDVIKINLNVTLVANESTAVYVTYRYSPRLYYESILQTWQLKKANDESALEEKTTLLGTITTTLEGLQEDYTILLNEKDDAISKFNAAMGSAIREGYWQPDDYKDEGDHYTETDTFTSIYNSEPLIADSGKGIKIGWDNQLFDNEDKIYYEESVLLSKQYYPCIDISNSTLFTFITQNFINTNLTADKKISFIFQNNYYKDLTAAEKNYIQNISNFTVGADAILGFIHTNDNNIKPVIILTGTRNMTDEEIKFMLNPSSGNPRIGILVTVVDENTSIASTYIRNDAISITPDMIYWDTTKINDNDRAAGLTGIKNINLCECVYPRIKFSSMKVKTQDTDNFNILYTDNNTLLTNYTDYQILTRITIRDEKAYPETFITIKPNTMIGLGTYTGLVTVKYSLSNAATSIYLDAKDVLLESAYPKVSYTIKVNVLQEELINRLHNILTQLVMINDTELKFKNVFGYISQVTLDLDQPKNDEIEVKNYKTKFEDLFSAIVAQTEEMKRNNSGLAVAISGGMPLTGEAFASTIIQNGDILQAYLDSYFDGSDVVQARLNSIFTEASKILAQANTSLNKVRTSTIENATILGGFIENINNELVPKVYTQSIKPVSYKTGDIWNETENNVIVARYVAILDSNDSSDGWIRTYNGKLASLSGASLDIDAVAGTIAILAQNQIDIQSGGNVEIAANEDVNIYGNKAVNIGGTTINIGSTTIEDTTITGGINLVATAYNTSNFAGVTAAAGEPTISKVLIHPEKIEMTAADIYLKGGRKILSVASDGTSPGTSAIQIDTTDGIWLGSGAGIKLYSGDSFSYNDTSKSLTALTGASIELNSQHLLLGYSATTTAAIEMTDEYLVIADGNTILTGSYEEDPDAAQIEGYVPRNKILTGITGLNTGLVGVKITNDSIGLAVRNNANMQAFLMNNDGISLASGSIDLTQTTADLRSSYEQNSGPNGPGSYMRLAGSGIEFGSLANIYINTNNFKLQTDSINAADLTKTDIGNTILAVGKNLQRVNYETRISGLRTMVDNGEADVNLVLNKDGLYIKGTVFATAFQASCNEGYFRADGNMLGFYDNTQAKAPMMTMTGRQMTCYGQFNIEGTNLFIGNSSFDAIQLAVHESSVEETVVTYHMHTSNNVQNPPTPVGGSTPDAGWTTYIPAKNGANVYLWSAVRTKYGNNTYYYGNVTYEGEIDKLKEVTQVLYARNNSTTSAPSTIGSNVGSTWFAYIPAPTITTSTVTDSTTGQTYSKETVTDPYVWRVIKTIKADNTVSYGTPVYDSGLSKLSGAAVDAVNIASGAVAVQRVNTTGINVSGNDLTVGSTGNLKVIGNGGVYIGANINNLAQSAIILNSSGMALGTNKTLALSGASITIADSSANDAVKINGSGIEIYSGKKIKVSASDIELVAASGSTPAVTVQTVKDTADSGATTATNIANGTTAVPHVSTTGITINSSGVTITSAANFSLTTNGTINIQTGGIFKVTSNNFIVNSEATGTDPIFEVKYKVGNEYKTSIKSTITGTTISGWTLEDEWMWSGGADTCVCLVGANAGAYNVGRSHVDVNKWAMYAGATWPEQPPTSWRGNSYPVTDTPNGWAPFRVQRNGYLYAKDICVGNGPSWYAAYNENDSSTYSTDSSWAGYTGNLWFWAQVDEGRYGWKKFDGNAFVQTIYLTTKPKDYGSGVEQTIGGAIGSIFSWIRGQSSCFLAGTKVNLPDNDTIEIEKLTVGKEILVYDEARKRFTTAPVRAIKAYPHHSNIYELHLSNGNILFLTDDHPVLTRKGWKVANPAKFKKDDAHQLDVSMFEVNDILPTNGEDVILKEIIHRTDLQDMTVYNFDVEAYDGYVVEGIIARNYEVK